ncbi:MAG: TipAS antibiotic-recognition domain-containing protein [Deltaproteobacteria bacterium]|nr:TipAS antibiotic-recognition domain-containing protein [Deltaproteobacteria bacterium]
MKPLKIGEIARRLAQLLEQGQSDDADAVEVLLKTMEVMSMYEKYLTDEQLKRVNDQHAAAGADAEAEWNVSLQGLRSELAAGTDPSAAAVQALVARWHQAAEAFMPADDEGLHAGMMKALHNEPEALAQHGLDAELFAYIGRALAPTEHP